MCAGGRRKTVCADVGERQAGERGASQTGASTAEREQPPAKSSPADTDGHGWAAENPGQAAEAGEGTATGADLFSPSSDYY